MGKSKTIIAGNWKMHLTMDQSEVLATRVQELTAKYVKDVEVVICPSYIALARVSEAAPKLSLGVQDVFYADEGAYTGEVAAAQAKEFAQFAIVGHSERRHIFNESSEDVARKAAACIRNEMTPIVCVGETEVERDHGETRQVLNDQIAASLTMLTAGEVRDIVIAYEPVWAIGTGKNARPEDVTAAVATIRAAITEMFGAKTAAVCRILYGGSVKADTAASYLKLEGVNGLLVGGASLNDHEFSTIVEWGSTT